MRGLLSLLICVLAARLFAQQPASEEGRSSFCVVDIFVDSKASPLAAYQLQFFATNGTVKIVGIEGGEHPAFSAPPFYDPKAIQHDRVIIAAFNTASENELPKGKTRVATLHLQSTDDKPLQCAVKLQTAGNADGTKIIAEASWEQRKNK